MADGISGDGEIEEGRGGEGGEAGGGGGGGRCRGMVGDTGTGGERTGDGSGEAAVGMERVVAREVLEVDEGLWGGEGGGGRGMDEGSVGERGGRGWGVDVVVVSGKRPLRAGQEVMVLI